MIKQAEYDRLIQILKQCGPLRSLAPAAIQDLYAVLIGYELPDDRRSPERFILALESWHACGQHDRVLSTYANTTDLRIQDVKFRAQSYRIHGVPPIEQMGYELSDFTCSIPFEKLDILPGGSCHLCCAVWQRQSIGSVFESDAAEVWNSSTAQDIRRGVTDGSFRYCGKQLCAFIAARELPVKSQVHLVSPTPKHFNLSYDRTCNLSCPSCRSAKIIETGPQRDFLVQMTIKKIAPMLKQGESVHITGSGDPFASRVFRMLLEMINPEEYPQLRLNLATNGLLFSESEWFRFRHLHGMLSNVNVSVDASFPETYAIVRQGGVFSDLLPNLHFIGRLRAQGAIQSYKLCFVVQAANFREMVPFTELAASVGADAAHFQRFVDWGSMTSEQVRNASVHEPEHPSHGEFVEVLRTPVFCTPSVIHEFAELLE